MELLRAIFGACIAILNKPIYLFGYYVSLSNVFIYVLIATVLLRLFYRLFR